jgi:hypothetical protein
MKESTVSLHQILEWRKQIYPKSILNTLTNSTKSSSSCSMPCTWGKQNDTEALKQYISHKQNCVNVCSLCGFVVAHDASEPSSSIGLVEIKCRYSKRDITIDEACEDKYFHLSKVDGKILLK